MPSKTSPSGSQKDQVEAVLADLQRLSTAKDRQNPSRFGITANRAFGVSMANIQALAKRLGQNHRLAAALWKSGWYEARLLTSYLDDPAQVTPAQMDRWCRDFDNWGICDTVCFVLFDRTPHAWAKVTQWSGDDSEFVKRAAFALLASLAGHDKQATDEAFLATFPLIERAATDDRNFVRKGVSWALRRIGTRSAPLHAASIALAQRLAESSQSAERWVGKDTLRDLTRPLVTRRFSKTTKGKRV